LNRFLRAAVPLGAALATGALALLAPVGAGAVTVACSTHTVDPFCDGQSTVQTVPQALSVQGIPGSRSGQALVAVTPAVTRRQDWDARPPVSGGSGSGGPNKIFRWAPSGVRSKWCMTDVGGLRSPVRLEPCTGANNQIWKPIAEATGVNWISKATGLALTNAGGSVQVRSPGDGTGLNKRWLLVP
jgi:hypothetical protein